MTGNSSSFSMIQSLMFMGFSTLARLLSGAFLFLFVARVLGPNEFGLFVFLFSCALLMSLIVEFGQSTYVMRELGIAPSCSKHFLNDVVLIKLVLSAVYILACLLFIAFAGKSEKFVFVSASLFLVALLTTWADFANACFRGVGDFRLETCLVVSSSIFHILLVVVALVFFSSIFAVALAFLFSRLVYAGASLYFFHRKFALSRSGIFARADIFSTIFSGLSRSFAYAVDSFLVSVRSYADVFLITAFLGTTSLGVYQSSMNVVRALENLGPVIANVYLPKLASLLNSPEEFSIRETQLNLLLFFSGAILCLFFFLLTPEIVVLVLGDSYVDVAELLPFFGLYIFLRYVAMSLGVVLTVKGFQGNRAIAGILSLVVLLSFAFFFLPDFGLAGMLLALLAASLFLLIWFLVALRSSPSISRFVAFSLVVSVVVLYCIYWLGPEVI